ncbi:MAG: protein kinase [Planctomycetia bacterium]|nr:protein kinase [Planctomycetia bacterium]
MTDSIHSKMLPPDESVGARPTGDDSPPPAAVPPHDPLLAETIAAPVSPASPGQPLSPAANDAAGGAAADDFAALEFPDDGTIVVRTPGLSGGSSDVPADGEKPGLLWDVNPETSTIISKAPPLPAPLAAPEPAQSRADIVRGMVGQQLEHFQLQEVVGGGGMGVVFRALDTRLNRVVALKVLLSDRSHDEETVRRFRNEAQSAARLDHENIARVYYVGADRGLDFIVFEFIDGTNLRDLVGRTGPLSVADALNYTIQVADALAHASSRDVVHRDIKPSNVLVTPGGRAKLVDMGLARLHDVEPADELTASGVTLGTFDYISPEQAYDPRSADVRSDIYSLGCTLYFAVTGQPPFPKGSALQKLLMHKGGMPPDPRSINPAVPEEVSRVLRKMLAKEPQRRHQTPAELMADLWRAADRLGIELSSVSPPYAARPLWGGALAPHLPWAVPVAALTVALFILNYVWSRTGETTLPSELSPRVAAAASSGTQPGATSADAQGASETPGAGPFHLQPIVPTRPGDNDLIEGKIFESPGPVRRLSGSGAGTTSPGSEPAGGNTVQSTPTGAAGGTTPENTGASQAAGGPTRVPGSTGSAAPPDAASGSQPKVGSPTGSATPMIERPLQGAESGGTSAAGTSTPGGSSAGANAPAAGASGAGSEMPPERPGVLVVHPAGDGTRKGGYATLKAAVDAAKTGDVIELRFNGRQIESPLKVSNLNLTIRGAEGYRPIVSFRPTEFGVEFPRSMLVVSGGQIKLVNMELELDLPATPIDGGWSLVELRKSEVTVSRCVLSALNTLDQRSAYHRNKVSFFLSKADARAAMAMMPETMPEEAIAKISLADTIARGQATLLDADSLQTVQFSWDNGLLSTTEYLLRASGSAVASRGSKHTLRLDHVTANVRRGMCLLTVSPDAAHVLPADVQCSNCLLIGSPDAPLIEQIAMGSEESPSRLFWSGSRNVYEGFRTFWKSNDLAATHPPQEMNFESWRAFWQERENLSSLGPAGWKQLPAEPGTSVQSHSAEDFQLRDDSPAHGAASDGEDIGLLPGSLPSTAAPTPMGQGAAPVGGAPAPAATPQEPSASSSSAPAASAPL